MEIFYGIYIIIHRILHLQLAYYRICPNMRLVGGFKHFLFSIIYFHIWDVILPIDEFIFFKMVIAPPKIRGTPKWLFLTCNACWQDHHGSVLGWPVGVSQLLIGRVMSELLSSPQLRKSILTLCQLWKFTRKSRWHCYQLTDGQTHHKTSGNSQRLQEVTLW